MCICDLCAELHLFSVSALLGEMRCILGTLGEVDAWVCVSSLPVPQASDLFTSVLMF